MHMFYSKKKTKYKERVRREYQVVIRNVNNIVDTLLWTVTEDSEITYVWGIEKASLRHSDDEKEPVVQTFCTEMSKCKGPEAENKSDSFKKRSLN